MRRRLVAPALTLAMLAGFTAQAHGSAFELSLMQDDNQLIYSSQSGLFTADNKAKPSATAYMLPFVIKKTGGSYLFWGQVRFTANGADLTMQIQRKQGGGWVNDGDPIRVTNSVGSWQL